MSIFATFTEAPTKRDKTDVVEIRSCLKEMDQLKKEKEKEKMPLESSISIREKPNQMMLSIPLELFLRDLDNQEEQPNPTTLKD